MSIKAMGWYWEHSAQSGHKLLALLALADWANDDGDCYPRMERIAQRIRRDPRSAQRAVTELEVDGELLIYPGEGSGQRGQKSPRYYLLRYMQAHSISLPPMIVEDARRRRCQDRIAGQKAARLRRQRLALTGDTDVTPTGDTDVTPTGDTDVTPTGDTRVTQIHHIDPSVFNHHSDPSIIHHPPSIDQGVMAGSMVRGGGCSILALQLIRDYFNGWNNAVAYVFGLDDQRSWALCTWLWAERLLQAKAPAVEGDPSALLQFLEDKREVEAAYTPLFAGVSNKIGLIRRHVASNYAAPLLDVDVNGLRAAIEREVLHGEG